MVKTEEDTPLLLSISSLILFLLSSVFVFQYSLYSFQKRKHCAVLTAFALPTAMQARIFEPAFARLEGCGRELVSQNDLFRKMTCETYLRKQNLTSQGKRSHYQTPHLRGGSGVMPASDLDVPRKVALKPSSTTRGFQLCNYKRTLKLSQRQKEVAIGVMLGDASLHTQNKGKTFRLKFQGSVKHTEYGRDLHKEFESFCLSEPRTFNRRNENNKIVESWEFQTLSHEEFDFIAKVFYNENSFSKKAIKSKLVEEFVTPTALAYWFMDDGSKMDHTKNEGKGIQLHTQGFQEDEVESLCKGLENRYGFRSWKGRNKGRFVVNISGNSYEEFVKIVKPELVPSMLYKLPSERRGLRRKRL